jgi:hypothetical protein
MRSRGPAQGTAIRKRGLVDTPHRLHYCLPD